MLDQLAQARLAQLRKDPDVNSLKKAVDSDLPGLAEGALALVRQHGHPDLQNYDLERKWVSSAPSTELRFLLPVSLLQSPDENLVRAGATALCTYHADPQVEQAILACIDKCKESDSIVVLGAALGHCPGWQIDDERRNRLSKMESFKRILASTQIDHEYAKQLLKDKVKGAEDWRSLSSTRKQLYIASASYCGLDHSDWDNLEQWVSASTRQRPLNKNNVLAILLIVLSLLLWNQLPFPRFTPPVVATFGLLIVSILLGCCSRSKPITEGRIPWVAYLIFWLPLVGAYLSVRHFQCGGNYNFHELLWSSGEGAWSELYKFINVWTFTTESLRALLLFGAVQYLTNEVFQSEYVAAYRHLRFFRCVDWFFRIYIPNCRDEEPDEDVAVPISDTLIVVCLLVGLILQGLYFFFWAPEKLAKQLEPAQDKPPVVRFKETDYVPFSGSMLTVEKNGISVQEWIEKQPAPSTTKSESGSYKTQPGLQFFYALLFVHFIGNSICFTVAATVLGIAVYRDRSDGIHQAYQEANASIESAEEPAEVKKCLSVFRARFESRLGRYSWFILILCALISFQYAVPTAQELRSLVILSYCLPIIGILSIVLCVRLYEELYYRGLEKVGDLKELSDLQPSSTVASVFSNHLALRIALLLLVTIPPVTELIKGWK